MVLGSLSKSHRANENRYKRYKYPVLPIIYICITHFLFSISYITQVNYSFNSVSNQLIFKVAVGRKRASCIDNVLIKNGSQENFLSELQE